MNPKFAFGSAVWSTASLVARNAARRGWLHSTVLDARRVISVGNLQAGGSGKTPLVALLAREACERNLATCILSRGYLSDWEIQGGVIEPGSEPVNPDLSGDEPALLQTLVPQGWIAVGADRVKQYAVARSRLGRPFDIVIQDDGFQHWKIKKDVEILALTSVLPSERYYRDFLHAAKSADLLIWTKGRTKPETFGRPWAHVRYHLNFVEGAPLWLITGVGDPMSVIIAARQAGFEIKRELSLPDHAVYERSLIRRWLKGAKAENLRIAITGKDWVKWRQLGFSKDEVLVLEPEPVFESGREHWDRVLWGS
jgi:tetraacyldisaccharide 4'-kinase